ncbi:MAG: hypothetical protein Q8M92_00425, partial [Candidatus Subteraquimicrobiales bacterium]|nr:hypothetical protein [Candidatus Subteraquimicrobiales bacterium]
MGSGNSGIIQGPNDRVFMVLLCQDEVIYDERETAQWMYDNVLRYHLAGTLAEFIQGGRGYSHAPLVVMHDI